MRFNRWSRLGLILAALVITPLAMSLFRTPVKAQMNQPETVILKGRVIDLTCAVKGKAMTGTWNNVAEDHMLADGSMQEKCSIMCLMGGQPAALFADNDIQAIFACNPRGSSGRGGLARYSSAPVEVEGYWGGGGPDAKVFVPLKIRSGMMTLSARVGTGGWRNVDCAVMHQ